MGWLAASQSLANIPSYLRGSLQVTLGYSSAMSTTSGRGLEDLFAAVLALAGAALYAACLRGGDRHHLAARPRRWRCGLVRSPALALRVCEREDP